MRPAVIVASVIFLVACPAAAEEARPWSLDDAIRIAQATSPFVAGTRHGLTALERQVDEAWWAWLPTLKFRTVGTVIPPQGEDPLRDEDGRLLEPDLRDTNFWGKMDIEAYVPIYTFGKISSAQAMARHGADMGRQGIRVAQGEVAYQVTRAWYGIALGSELTALVSEAERHLEKARKRLEELEASDSPEFDQDDRFRLRLYEADVAKIVREYRRLSDVARAGLGVAMGRKPSEPLQLPPDPVLEPVTWVVQDLKHYLDLATRERPELQLGRHRVAVANADADRRKAELFPDFFAAANFTWAFSTVEFETNAFSSVAFNALGGGALIGVQMTLDIPQKIARWRKAQAEHRKARSELEGSESTLRFDLEEAWREVRDLSELLPFQENAVRAARSLLVSKTQAYEEGLDESTTIKDVLDAAVLFLQRKAEWLRTVYTFNVGVARLSRVVGTDVTKTPGATR